MTSDINWGGLPQDVQPMQQDAGIDVPTQLDVFPDGEPSLTIGDVQGYAAFNHQQGDNPYGFQEDCGLVSCQDVLNQFGVPVNESDVVGHAIQNGECDVEQGDPADSGGTSTDEQAQILTDYGVPRTPRPASRSSSSHRMSSRATGSSSARTQACCGTTRSTWRTAAPTMRSR